MKKGAALVACLLWALSAQGMGVSVQGPTVFASGLVEDDYRKFVEALDQPGVEQVVFVNSPGGDLWTGMRVGRMIADKGFKTVVAGSCISACSIMFMGGRERTFSDAFVHALTYVGIHGPHNKLTRAVSREQAGQIYAFFRNQMDGHFNADIINQALFDMDDAGALLRVFDAYRAPKLPSYHCKSEHTARKDCTEYQGEDAYTLGVVTSVDLTHVDLPLELREKPYLAGTLLNTSVPDPELFYKDLSARQCKSDNCQRSFVEFPSYKDHKALAIPVHDTGYGMANGRDTLPQAYVAALYYCNHVKGQPARLCEVQVVDGYDVRALLQEHVQSHSSALAALRMPTDRFYASEEEGGALAGAPVFKTRNLQDITPQKLDGIRTLGTQELATLLQGPQPPVLVDVWAGANEAIPTAVTLFGGGVAYDDAAVEAEYAARFAGLLKLLSPDPAQPLVFYCLGRECWLSVNAAIRARQLGYSQVGWYRGGWVSWKAAGLATARVVVRAVVQ
jgi:rhodanese-related sulfurtransferase